VAWLGQKEAESALKKYKRKHGKELGSCDAFLAAREVSSLPLASMQSYLASRTPSVKGWQDLPATCVDSVADKDELALEAKLAKAGRIRPEDLDVGKEFDQPLPIEASEVESSVDDSKRVVPSDA
jgi:hypothetical protein